MTSALNTALPSGFNILGEIVNMYLDGTQAFDFQKQINHSEPVSLHFVMNQLTQFGQNSLEERM